MKTIAQELGITDFPFEIRDDRGNIIYKEFENGFWAKWEYDEEGEEIYYEDSYGQIIDSRPKPEPEPMTIEIDGKKYKLTEI